MAEAIPKVGIVGAGPSGLVAALLLQKAGVDAVCFERRGAGRSLPQSHVVNLRTVEILRELGVEELIVSHATPHDRAKYVTWSETLAGVQCGKSRHPTQQTLHSPVRVLNIGQDRLEELLMQVALERGIDIRRETKVEQAKIIDGQAQLTVTHDGVSTQYEFDYVLACDGVSSTVRKAFDIAMEGEAELGRWVNCYFRANLDRYIKGREGPVNFIAGPDARGCIIGYDVQSIWAYLAIIPPGTDASDFPAEVMEEFTRRAIGDPDLEMEVLGVSAWIMQAMIAERFREGPYFLLGDAAHRFPPTGGLGVNTAIQDAHNIAWKLAAVVRGEADPALLNSYEAERKPTAARNCKQSMANLNGFMETDAVIGAPSMAPIDAQAVKRPPAPPADLGLSGDSPEAQARRAAVQATIDRNFGALDWAQIDIGFSYARETDLLLPYRPSTEPGSLLPHIWLEQASGRVSTLDVIDRVHPTLLVGSQANEWVLPAQDIARQHGTQLAVIDVAEQFNADMAEWTAVMEIEADGAVLVRPDGHVAWRSIDSGDQPEWVALDKALRAVTGR